jgi:uncharacterized protein (TIGR02231 family)
MSALALWLLPVSLLSAAPQIDEVVVFPDRAQITRLGRAPCTAGRAKVVFEALPPSADPGSFRASARGGTVEGLRSYVRNLEQAYSRELAALEAQDRSLRAELQGLVDAQQRTGTATALASRYTQVAQTLVSRDMAAGRADPKGWERAFDAALGIRLEGAEQAAKLRLAQTALAEKLQDVGVRRARLAGAAARKEQVAEVLVDCGGDDGIAQVALTYLVGGASWSPLYEARADEGKGQVELSTFATVTQSTGEDWRNAKLVLSTAIPVEDATLPELKRLEVLATERKEHKKVLVRREEEIRHAQSGQGRGGEREPGLAAREQGLSVQLEVPGRAEVRGDGTAVRVLVSRSRMPARFAWRTAPSLTPFVFRVAQVTNTAAFPLLQGQVDGFRRSGFIGRHALERVPQGGAFELSFGLEDRMKVKRVVVEELARDSGLFQQRRRFRYAYRLELQNRSGGPEELEVVERIPVSELEDIRVEIEKAKTTAGYELAAADGLVVWKVKLRADEAKTVDLAFHVDVPDSYETGGL